MNVVFWRMRGLTMWAAGSLLLAGLAGCTGGVDDMPDIAEVYGTVTLDDEPLPDATVHFQPEEGRPSYGRTNAEGYYELYYKPGQEGAMIGEHTVSIRTYQEGSPGEPEIPEKVPAQFNARTELTRNVASGGNEFNFELDSEGEIIQPVAPEGGGGYGGGGYGNESYGAKEGLDPVKKE